MISVTSCFPGKQSNDRSREGCLLPPSEFLQLHAFNSATLSSLPILTSNLRAFNRTIASCRVEDLHAWLISDTHAAYYFESFNCSCFTDFSLQVAKEICGKLKAEECLSLRLTSSLQDVFDASYGEVNKVLYLYISKMCDCLFVGLEIVDLRKVLAYDVYLQKHFSDQHALKVASLGAHQTANWKLQSICTCRFDLLCLSQNQYTGIRCCCSCMPRFPEGRGLHFRSAQRS